LLPIIFVDFIAEPQVMQKLGIPLPTTTTTGKPTLPSWAETTTTPMTTPEVPVNNVALDPQLIDDLETTKAKLAENSSKVSKILTQLDNQDRELKMVNRQSWINLSKYAMN
jgi:hypothetical protein